MERRLRQYDVKGASAAVVLPDSRLLLAAAGISHDRVRMSPDMAFAVGSITKNMVAAMLLQLAEGGMMSVTIRSDGSPQIPGTSASARTCAASNQQS